VVLSTDLENGTDTQEFCLLIRQDATGVSLEFGKIWSRWFSSTWATGDQVSLSGRCALKRETSQCRRERKGRCGLTGSIGVLW
jgi:hypothetical protein